MVTSELTDGIGTIALDNPQKRNALSLALVDAVLAALDDLRDRAARVVVLRAAGDGRVWCAGHDIAELHQGRDPLLQSDPLERLVRAVRAFPAPVLAMIRGSVWGGGTDLVLSCDVVIGDETSSFGITPANLGLPYNTTGLLQFMRRLPLNVVKEMFFTAAPITAQKAEQWGVLNHLVPAAELERFTYDMASLIATKAPLAVSVVKEQLRLLAEADPVTPDVFERIQDLRQRVFESEDYTEGLKAFFEKRQPRFVGR